jgi:hypothetical protein
MTEKLYSVYGKEEILDSRLAVEIGDSYIVLVAGINGNISGLEYYSTDDDLDETLENISHQSLLLKKNYSETKVFCNLKESVFVPVGLFNTAVASEFVELAFGNRASSRVNVEHVNVAPGILNVYRSNENWQEIISRHFRAVTKRHLYSKLVEDTIARRMEIRVIFYKDSFIVVALNDDQLRIARSFDFSNDADILYHLLNTCKQVDIIPSEVALYICGLIDTNTPAFALLGKYFDLIVINNEESRSLPENKYPDHYFNSFINLLS